MEGKIKSSIFQGCRCLFCSACAAGVCAWYMSSVEKNKPFDSIVRLLWGNMKFTKHFGTYGIDLITAQSLTDPWTELEDSMVFKIALQWNLWRFLFYQKMCMFSFIFPWVNVRKHERGTFVQFHSSHAQ